MFNIFVQVELVEEYLDEQIAKKARKIWRIQKEALPLHPEITTERWVSG
ncbi:MAG: hypothetical protein K2L21_05830 [Muribaculaceae bacterium]|nr:hypothetical protein [Muribaculaceae bacterium]